MIIWCRNLAVWHDFHLEDLENISESLQMLSWWDVSSHHYEKNYISCERLTSDLFLFREFYRLLLQTAWSVDSSDDSSISTVTSSCSLVKLFSLSKNLRMYNVTLKTGLSPSADDHSISNLKRREERTRLSCLKIRSVFIGTCTICSRYARL